MIFETHAHYDDKAYDNDRDKIITLLKEEGVSPIVNVGASMRGCRDSLELAHKYNHVYAAIGIHPSDCAELTESDMDWLRTNAGDNKVVAIGEIGLDYHYDEPDSSIQKKWFKRQLDLSMEVRLPVIIHSRDAAKDTLDILSEDKYKSVTGIIHCFSYSVEMSREYLKMGYYIGVGGVVTFKNGRKLHEVVKDTPIERIVLETDCPYLSPEPFRGKRNSSAHIPYIIDRIAMLKNMNPIDVENITYENAKRVYGITWKN